MEKKKEIQVFDEELSVLKEKFEEILGCPIITADDYRKINEFLIEKIPNRIKLTNNGNDKYVIHLKTLKRVFNKTPEDQFFSKSTLTILSYALGFKDWDDFLKYIPRFKLTNDDFGLLFNPDEIVVSELKEGDIVTIGWKPIYYIEVKYLGDFVFRVLGGNLDKMKNAKEFRARKFILDYSSCANLDSETHREGYPLFPKIYATMDENAANIIG